MSRSDRLAALGERAMPGVRPGFIKISAVVLLLLVPAAAHAVWDYRASVRKRRKRCMLRYSPCAIGG